VDQLVGLFLVGLMVALARTVLGRARRNRPQPGLVPRLQVFTGRRFQRLTLLPRLGWEPHWSTGPASPVLKRVRHGPRALAIELGRGPVIVEAFELRDCRLSNSHIAPSNDPLHRSTVRRGSLSGCVLEFASPTAIFEDLEIQDLRTTEPVTFSGCAFRHVRLRGAIGSILVRPWTGSGPRAPAQDALAERFRRENERYYRGVDWALDISEAVFAECELRDIPAHLVRRNPAHHFLVKRSKVLDGRWRTRPIKDTYFELALAGMMKEDTTERILVAPMRSRDHARLLAALEDLRESGIAEPG